MIEYPVAIGFQLAAGVMGLVSVWLHGNMSLKGPIAGIVAQLCWLGVILTTPNTYGLFLVFVGFMVVNIRNLIRWHRMGVRWRSTPALTRSA